MAILALILIKRNVKKRKIYGHMERTDAEGLTVRTIARLLKQY